MKRACLLAVLSLLLAPSASAAPLKPADRAWIGACADQLKAEKMSKRSVQKYCTCMHDYFEDNAKVSQSEMEHLFPPAHRTCRRKPGRWRACGKLQPKIIRSGGPPNPGAARRAR